MNTDDYKKDPLHKVINFIFGWFGYTKIPIEVIRLSMELEHGYKFLFGRFPAAQQFAELHRGAKELTRFLRSGRRLDL